MKIRIKWLVGFCLSTMILLSCSNKKSIVVDGMEEKLQAVVALSDMNKSLSITVDDNSKIFPRDSDIPIQVKNTSHHFLYFDLEKNYIKLFTIRNGEWIEIKDGLIGSGSRVLSPQDSPPLNLDFTWTRPLLGDDMLQNNETDVLLRIVMTGEIMAMDTYSENWRDRENDILTGDFVGAYVDVFIRP